MSRHESPGFINNWSLLNSEKKVLAIEKKYLKNVFIKEFITPKKCSVFLE